MALAAEDEDADEDDENEEAVSVLVKDMRLYHRRLTSVEYLSLARDQEVLHFTSLLLPCCSLPPWLPPARHPREAAVTRILTVSRLLPLLLQFMECLDLDLVSDNSEWISDFGQVKLNCGPFLRHHYCCVCLSEAPLRRCPMCMNPMKHVRTWYLRQPTPPPITPLCFPAPLFCQTCADFSGLSEASSDGVYAPAACRNHEMKSNCPVSCMHELNPACFDGTPPIPKQGSLYATLGSRSEQCPCCVSSFQCCTATYSNHALLV